jgi:hypothetical protein
VGQKAGDVLVVPCRSCRLGTQGYVHASYTPDEVDAIAAYNLDVDRCYLLRLSEFRHGAAIQLRLGPTRNNQRRGIHWAENFELAATLNRGSGAIAQLGERDAGSVEVAGSSPAGSTL